MAIDGLKHLFRCAQRLLSRGPSGSGWGDPGELSIGRFLGCFNAYCRAVPRVERFEFTFPREKAELLKGEGIEVLPDEIVRDKLEEFRDFCDYSKHYLGRPQDGGFWGKAYREKSLEHFLSYTLLQLREDDILIDVAAAQSNFAENMRRLTGCRALRQDLVFPSGIHGDAIGGDATSMPVPDNFATALTLHCSLEHFEGDADIRFVREAARVLAPGGRVIILPVYLERHHLNMTQPELWNPRIPLDPGASWYFPPESLWNNRFGRFYSARAFRERIAANLGPFDWRIVWFRNREELYPELWCDFALLASLAK